MSKAALENTEETETTVDAPKTRQCLRCQSEFESAWAGERICSRCKGSNAWRSSVPLTSTSPSGSR